MIKFVKKALAKVRFVHQWIMQHVFHKYVTFDWSSIDNFKEENCQLKLDEIRKQMYETTIKH